MSVFFDSGRPGPTGPAGPAGATGGAGPGIGSVINPYMDCFSQEGSGAIVTLVSGNSYADGWIVEADTIGNDSVGRQNSIQPVVNCGRQLQLNKGVGASGKMLITQFFDNQASLSWTAETMLNSGLFAYSPDGANPGTLRLAVLSCNNGVNAIPRPIVTAWNGDGVDPTFDASITNVGALSLAPGHTGFFAGTQLQGVPFGGYDHIGIAVWTNEACSVGGLLQVSKWMALPNGSSVVYPQRPETAINDLSCQKLIEKSYARDVDPGTVTDNGAFEGVGGQNLYVRYRVPKLFDPNGGPGTNPQNGLTFYSTATGAPGMIRDVTAGGDVAPAIVDAGPEGFRISTGAPAGNVLRGHFLANAHL